MSSVAEQESLDMPVQRLTVLVTHTLQGLSMRHICSACHPTCCCHAAHLYLPKAVAALRKAMLYLNSVAAAFCDSAAQCEGGPAGLPDAAACGRGRLAEHGGASAASRNGSVSLHPSHRQHGRGQHPPPVGQTGHCTLQLRILRRHLLCALRARDGAHTLTPAWPSVSTARPAVFFKAYMSAPYCVPSHAEHAGRQMPALVVLLDRCHACMACQEIRPAHDDSMSYIQHHIEVYSDTGLAC